jgi:hypothetical protein
LFAAIAAEVAQRAAGAEAEIMAWYLAGVAHAMRHMSPTELQAALRALKGERTVRLAAVRRNAATERRARQQAATDGQAGEVARTSRLSPLQAVPTCHQCGI